MLFIHTTTYDNQVDLNTFLCELFSYTYIVYIW